MVTIETIIQFLEERADYNETIKDSCLYRSALHEDEVILKWLKDQPSLPSTLEEAAEEYGRKQYGKNPALLPDRCNGCYAPLVYAFKAGAQWRDKQIPKLPSTLKEAAKKYQTDLHKMEDDVDDEGYMYENVPRDAFKKGAEWMASQIRKKE